MMKEIEIPEGYEARIEGNKVVIELKNSEDERIRKSIIHLLQVGGYMSPEDKTKAFAWLEKQKEQKPVFRVGDIIIAKDETCIPKEPFHIERIEDDYYWDGDNSILICNQDEFQLIEQQPVEWSENDKRILDEAINMIKAGGCWIRSEDAIEQVSDFLKSLPARFSLQSKVEWGEEDEKMIKDIIDYMLPIPIFYGTTTGQSGKEFTREFIKKATTWLKSLRPQLKQERYLGMKDQWCCNAALAAVRNSDAYNEEEKQSIFDFLQRCKPQSHWKPSEVQMDALAWYSGNSGVPPIGDKAIKSLYIDLQKLL